MVLVNTGLCAQHTVRPNKLHVGVWSRERFVAGSCKENGWFLLKKKKIPDSSKDFSRAFLKAKAMRAGFPGGSVVKNLPTNARDSDSIPGFRRSPGGGNSNPL